ncbi:HtaA domain-containing protein [Dactylosporangium sp. NPDC048998]|uniref:HtaA domain-containing protein n=1 Tax=Dactylosporangium sp. NPDC048998 TaxID=3363976 RepID=UPI003719484E
MKVNLTWPIRQSFLRYIDTVGGTTEISEELSRGDDAFVFPGTSSGPTRWEFRGSARFEAHGGMLSVTIGDPIVDLDNEPATLTVATATGPDAPRATIAHLIGIEAQGSALRANARLTVEGSRLLGDVYNPGDLLDPILIDTEARHA